MNTRRGFLASLAALVTAPIALAVGKKSAGALARKPSDVGPSEFLVDAADWRRSIEVNARYWHYWTYNPITGKIEGPFEHPPEVAAPAPIPHHPSRNVRAPHGGQTRGGHRRSGGKR